MKRVLLLSTVHPATDSRVMYKILPSLRGRYEVFCALPGISAIALRENRNLIGLPAFNRLLPRAIFAHPVALFKCLHLRPDIIHIFVPELIPLAFVFRWAGASVIYEVQENLFKKFAIKRYNNAPAFRKLFQFFDRLARKNFHCIFTDGAYLEEYSDLGKPFAIVHNYVSLPIADSIEQKPAPGLRNEFFYLGVVSLERCLDTIIQALAKLKARGIDFHLNLFGPLRVTAHELEQIEGYQHVKEHLTFHGYTDQKVAMQYAARALAGIALLKPVGDYPESYPTKLFEYMALGLPVITSDFPIYRGIVERAGCGFCISPFDADSLSQHLQWLVDDPAAGLAMGRKGRQAVERHYNWKSEEAILLSFYDSVLSNAGDCKMLAL